MNKILRMAASRVGYSLADLNSSDDPAREVVAVNFQSLTEAAIGNYLWHWADKSKDYPCTADATSESTDCPYAGTLVVEHDLIQIRSVRQCGKNLRYEREGKELKFWSLTNSDPVTIVGSWYLDVDCWPANFTEIMVWSFAAIIASSVIQDEGLASHAAKMADEALAKAKFSDSVQQTTPRIKATRLISRRRNSSTIVIFRQ